MQAPLVPVAAAFIVGVLVGARVPVAPWAALAVGVASAAAALMGRRRVRITAPALALMWICAGMLRMQAWFAHPDNRLAE